MVLKNRRVLLSSIAIVLTLIVSAIFVNFTLAGSNKAADDEQMTEIQASNSLTGYSNIDLAIVNSNDAAKKKANEDKFRVVQILPNSMSEYAKADQDITKIITASDYKGDVSKDSKNYKTSDLWKYVYDGEFFRLAVFNGYKEMAKDDMAKGAVQLTTYTVSELTKTDADGSTSIPDDVKEALSNADFVYVAAYKSSDYTGNNDISEDVYTWLNNYATVDNHPLVIDRYALGVDDPSTIKGNNDSTRMGAMAFRVITKTLTSRYDNVLVTEPGFFATLYKEANDNKHIDPMTPTTKTISDFILTAERTADEGGNDYIHNRTYYKWYLSDSFDDFTSGHVTHEDSAYAPVKPGSSGNTASRTSWEMDNANILVITKDSGEYNDIYNYLSENNDGVDLNKDTYTSADANGVWRASTDGGHNSVVTTNLYAKGMASVPSGANIYKISDADLKEAVENPGVPFLAVDPAATFNPDIETTKIAGTITTHGDLELDNTTLHLLVDTGEGVYKRAVDENGDEITLDIDSSDYTDDGNGGFVYKYEFPLLNPTYSYKVVAENGDDTLVVGINGNDYEIHGNGVDMAAGYTYTGVVATYQQYLDAVNNGDTAYADETSTADYVLLDTKDRVYAYARSLYDTYSAKLSAEAGNPTTPLDFSSFDFVFIESGKYSNEIEQNAYDLLCSAADQRTYFIVSSEAGDGKGSAGGNGGGGKRDDIIVTSPSAKALADIINAGVYRNGADNKFRVLEIQPDYPIDLEVASKSANVTTAWKKRTDGSAITGDYYTVPSDVVEGKAQEELQSLTEQYYDFDLTKAKLAYAIDGLSYGQIELTQVSGEAIEGMTADVMATYDLVYIGGDISALDRDPSEVYGSSKFGWNSGGAGSYIFKALPTFIMYYHTGMLAEVAGAGTYHMDRNKADGTTMLAVPQVTPKTTDNTFLAENGNDLTNTKLEQLQEYVNSGRPIIVSSELSSIYDKMNAEGQPKLSEAQLLMGYWYNKGHAERTNYYLDPSSRMYKLLGQIKSKSDSDSVVWGLDPSKEMKVDNSESKYGITNFTFYHGKIYKDVDAQKEAWYNNDGVVKCYATVYNNDNNVLINDAVKKSAKRARLTVITSPTAYKEGIESTYISTTNLSFTILVDGANKTYNYKLYVDKDKNTAFEDDKDYVTSGTVTSSEEKTISIALDNDFFGAAYWKIEITDAEGNVVAVKTGISKIVNTTDGISEINVLQVQTMAEGQSASTWTATDTLYFDIESQTAHKIAKYNTYANQVDLDNSQPQQYKALGLHENRFGIIEYDMGAGQDDYYSNLAEALGDDYDINLDMVVATQDRENFTTGDNATSSYDSLERWVAEAEEIETTGSYNGITKAEYETLAAAALSQYNQASADCDAPLKELQTFVENALLRSKGQYSGKDTATLDSFLNNFGCSVSERNKVLQYMIDTGEYHIIYWPKYNRMNHCAGEWSSGAKWSNDFGSKYGELLYNYTAARDVKITAWNNYRTNLRRSYGEDFLSKMYSILILGPSDSFGNYLVNPNAKTCEYILKYVGKGGDLFFFHDSMSTVADAGAVELTKTLLSVVGMNRFHVDLTNQANSYTVKDATVQILNPNGASMNGKKITDVQYKSSNKDLYYMTPYCMLGDVLLNSMNDALYADRQGEWTPALGEAYNIRISGLAMTNLYYNRNNGGATTTLPYVYAQESFTQATSWSGAANQDQSGLAQTVKAAKLNDGLVTMYPFQIGDQLNISGTHQQGFALDLESDKVNVWYTLAGSNNVNSAKTRSSLYAASPHDATESYFIYTTSYGSGAITYCGAGHSSVTGKTTKNNDERRLFINVIVNSAEAVTPKPKITIYEPDTDLVEEEEIDEEVQETTGKKLYLADYDSVTDPGKVDFKVTFPEGVKLTLVNVYFDLDYDDSDYTNRPSYNNKTDVMIKSYTTKDGLDKLAADATAFGAQLRTANTNGKVDLKDEYFEPYGGNYTYVVVEAYYQGGKNPVYVMYKLKVSDPLFNLTKIDGDMIAYLDAVAVDKKVIS